MATLLGAALAGSAGAFVALTLYFIGVATLQRVPLIRDFGMMWLHVLTLAPLGAFIGNAVLVLRSEAAAFGDLPWVHLLATVPVLSFTASVALVAWSSR